MRRLLAALGLCMGLIGSVAGPASAAAPMKNTREFSRCLSEGLFTSCIEGTETTKIIEKSDDTYSLQIKVVFNNTTLRNGVVVEKSTERFSYLSKVREGVETLVRSASSGNLGPGCTYDLKVLIVKGVVKQDVNNTDCDF